MDTATLLAHGPHHDGHGWWWIGGVFQLLFLILIVSFVVRVFFFRRRWARHGFAPWAQGNAYQVLAERYARGEIDAAEYTERLNHLKNNPPRP